MRLGWNRDEDGVITVYAHATDGRGSPIADFWLQPLIDKLGMKREAAKEWQEQFAELLVTSHNRLFHEAPKGGGLSAPWVCPIGRANCKSNCGSYGCGN